MLLSKHEGQATPPLSTPSYVNVSFLFLPPQTLCNSHSLDHRTIAIMGYTDVDKLAINTIRLLAVSSSLFILI
jgi:hypothetical protein